MEPEGGEKVAVGLLLISNGGKLRVLCNRGKGMKRSWLLFATTMSATLVARQKLERNARSRE